MHRTNNSEWTNRFAKRPNRTPAGKEEDRGGSTSGLKRFLALSLRTGLLLTLYALLDRWLTRLTAIPERGYEEAFLVFELGKRLMSLNPAALASMLLMVGAIGVGLWFRSLGPRWSSFTYGPLVRRLVVVIAFVLAWSYATYDYNFYFDQTHGVDRLILLALVPLLCWRPAFVFPFLLVLLPMLRQFDYPIGDYSWSEPVLLVRALMLFGALWLTRLVSGRIRTADFFFVLCCLVASFYWVPGLGKLDLYWIASDRLYYLLPATYANGWLGFLSPEAVARFTKAFSYLNTPMKIGTLLLEAGALFCLWRRSLLTGFLVGWIVLHIGIFFVTGIFFWKWITLDAAILVLFFTKHRPRFEIFTRAHFVVSLILIGGATLWFKPVELAWYDARMSYTYRFEAVGTSGKTYTLSPRFFSPYDYQFTLSGFTYLSHQPRLSVAWGATRNRNVAEALNASTTPSEIWNLEREMGREGYDPRRSAAFDDFIREFVTNWCKHGGELRWWHLLQAPPQLWTFSPDAGPDEGEQIAKVIGYEVTSLYDDSRYREIRKRRVRIINPEASDEGMSLQSRFR